MTRVNLCAALVALVSAFPASGPFLQEEKKGQQETDLEHALERLVPELTSEVPQERAQARGKLKTWVVGASIERRKLLRARAGRESDPEVKGALREALEGLPKLELRVRGEGTFKVGTPVAVRVTLVNISDEPQRFLEVGPDDLPRWLLYPRYSLELTDSGGTKVLDIDNARDYPLRRGSADTPMKFFTLQSGEECNVFHGGYFPDPPCWSTPKGARRDLLFKSSGKYEVRVVLDLDCPYDIRRDLPGISANLKLTEELQKSLAGLPKVKLSGKASIDVLP